MWKDAYWHITKQIKPVDSYHIYIFEKKDICICTGKNVEIKLLIVIISGRLKLCEILLAISYISVLFEVFIINIYIYNQTENSISEKIIKAAAKTYT